MTVIDFKPRAKAPEPPKMPDEFARLFRGFLNEVGPPGIGITSALKDAISAFERGDLVALLAPLQTVVDHAQAVRDVTFLMREALPSFLEEQKL